MSPTSQRTLRKSREQEWRRLDILNAAERLFSENGFFKTSMAEIAESAEFAIGTVYQFFKSKDEIYISLIENKMEDYAGLMQTRLAEVTSSPDKLQAVIRTKLEYFEQNRNFFRIYVSEWAGFEWTVKSALGEGCWKRYQEQLDLVENILHTGIQMGEFRAVNPKEAAFALHGMLNSTIYLWILQPTPSESLRSKSSSLLALYLHGVGESNGSRTGA